MSISGRGNKLDRNDKVPKKNGISGFTGTINYGDLFSETTQVCVCRFILDNTTTIQSYLSTERTDADETTVVGASRIKNFQR